jgi:hypothetical protein
LPEGVYPQDDFKDGYVVVRIKTEDHNSAVINHLGEIVRYPGDGIDLNQDGKVFAVKRNGLYGYINRSMELEITPQFDKAGDFVGQYAKVTKSGVECIINRAGEIVFSIEPYINMYGNQISISNPFDGVVILNHLYKLPDLVYQYISVEGEILTEPFEGDVTGFSEGYGVFMNGKFGKWIVIDKSGNVIEELPPADFYSTRREGLFIQLLGGEMRFVDERGSVVIEDQYTFVTPFFEGFAAVSKNERPINSTQRYFQYSNRRKEGLGSYQIINKDGVPINDFYYVGVPRFFQGGVAEVKILAEDGKNGIYSTN